MKGGGRGGGGEMAAFANNATVRKVAESNQLRLQMLELAVSHLTTTCNGLREEIHWLRTMNMIRPQPSPTAAAASRSGPGRRFSRPGTTTTMSSIRSGPGRRLPRPIGNGNNTTTNVTGGGQNKQASVIGYYGHNESSPEMMSRAGVTAVIGHRRRRSWGHLQQPVEVQFYGGSATASSNESKKVAGSKPKGKSTTKAYSKLPTPPNKATGLAKNVRPSPQEMARGGKSVKPSSKPKVPLPSSNTNMKATSTSSGTRQNRVVAVASQAPAAKKSTTTRTKPAAKGSQSSSDCSPKKKTIKVLRSIHRAVTVDETKVPAGPRSLRASFTSVATNRVIKLPPQLARTPSLQSFIYGSKGIS